MITSFKLYETLHQPPNVGDYIMIDGSTLNYIVEPKNPKDNTIGRITAKYKNNSYDVKFGPRFYGNYPLDCFKFWSDDIKELEKIAAMNKYNL